MSGEILTTIITILTVVGFISAQTVMMIRGQERIRKESKEEFKEVRAEFKEVHTEIKEVRAEIVAVDQRQSERLSAEIKEVRGDIAVVNERQSAEFKEVRADIAAVDKRLSHTDGLVEGLSRALLSTQAPAQAQAQA